MVVLVVVDAAGAVLAQTEFCHASGRDQGRATAADEPVHGWQVPILLSIRLGICTASHRRLPPGPSLGQSSLREQAGRKRCRRAAGHLPRQHPGQLPPCHTLLTQWRRLRQKPQGMGPGTGLGGKTQMDRAGNQRETLDNMGPGNMGKCAQTQVLLQLISNSFPSHIRITVPWPTPISDPACPRVPFCHLPLLIY